jgi:hypothetical protein
MFVLALVACGDDQPAPAGHDAFVDFPDSSIDAAFCGASGSCVNGPACGSACCGTGEKCVNGTCMCGGGSACTGDDTCMPGLFAPASCGYTCCGPSTPCPI